MVLRVRLRYNYATSIVVALVQQPPNRYHLLACSVAAKMIMMSQLFMLLFMLLTLPMNALCHFLHNQRRAGTSSLSSQTICNPRRRHLSVLPVAFLSSIRGGSDRGDENDDDFSDFVTSFESELVEIRREAELEAEAELEQLRTMLVGEKVYEESDKGSDNGEDAYDDRNADEGDSKNCTDEEDANGTDDQNSRDEQSVEEETQDASDVVDRISTTLEVLDKPGGDGHMSESERTDEEFVGGEEYREVQSDDERVEDMNESVEENVTIINDSSDDTKQGKSKHSKAKKSKRNKPTSKSKKPSRNLLDYNIEPLNEVEIDIDESAVLTQTIEKVVESRSRGIRSYLKSDLIRALAIFIATVIISLWMQRLQRQLEAQGN